MSRFVGCLTAVLCLVTAGCGSQVGPVPDVVSVVSVSGTATYQGKPLPGYQVTFLPVSGERPATGVTDADGKFTLGTNNAGDGAVAGPNKVAVVWVAPDLADDTMATPIDDPSKLPKQPVNVPAKFSNPETSGITIDVPTSGGSDLNVEIK